MDTHIVDLFTRFINNDCSQQEIDTVLDLIQKGAFEEEWKSAIEKEAGDFLNDPADHRVSVDDPEYSDLNHRIRASINKQAEPAPLYPPGKINWVKLTAIAAMLLIVIGVTFNLLYFPEHGTKPIQTAGTAIKPGGNKAFLTLADGSRIDMDSVSEGRIAEQLGIRITKTASGRVIYNMAAAGASGQSNLVFNKMETPRGGQYQLLLSDGSKVWLNSSSSLRFPASFSSATHRTVELEGEAYFEVAKDKHKPFLVRTSSQTVTVLGTHFNVNAYEDEPELRTTLLEGSVKVSSGSYERLIAPGQQSVLSRTTGALNVQTTDTEAVIAWRQGYFQFEDEEIESIMRKISRWYNVEIVYQQQGIKSKRFTGYISRYEDVSKVLKMLELTKIIRFKIIAGDSSQKERRIMVMM